MTEKKPPPIIRTDPSGPGIGQKADGSLDSFPLSELAARTAERDREEEAQSAAIASVFPGGDESAEQDLGDLSDLDDLDEALQLK